MNILITSAGRRAYLIKYFKEALGLEGKIFASNSAYSIALQQADDYLITPLIYEESYIDSILSFCKKQEIKAVISVFDIDLLVLSKAKEKFKKNGINLLVSEESVIEKCNDKWETFLFLRENGFKTPLTFKNLENLKKAIQNKEINYPIIMKPRWGMASMSIYIADNEEELDVFYKKSIKQIQNSYLKYESNITPDEPIVFQELLIGQEYGLDVINDLNGNFVCVLPKSKLVMRAGETDIGKTVSPNLFKSTAEKLSSLLKHEVILSVDCFVVENEIYIIEFNCRISGHYPLSHLAGVNLPKQIFEWLNNKPTDLNNFKFQEGLLITKDLNPTILDQKNV